MITRKGSAQPGVNASILSILDIPIAPIQEQQRIINCVNEKLSIIDVIESEIEKSLLRKDTLRNSILNKAFQGDLIN